MHQNIVAGQVDVPGPSLDLKYMYVYNFILRFHLLPNNPQISFSDLMINDLSTTNHQLCNNPQQRCYKDFFKHI